MNNDHVGAMEWEWVWSMLQSKQGSRAGIAQEEVLAKAQQQVHMHLGCSSLVESCKHCWRSMVATSPAAHAAKFNTKFLLTLLRHTSTILRYSSNVHAVPSHDVSGASLHHT